MATDALPPSHRHHHVQSSKDRGLLLGILRRVLKRDSVDITEKDPTLKVIYLGNVVTTWAKTEGCLERPASALWRNHSNGRGSIKMTVSVTPSGLKAQTAEHGLTEYWANRLTWTGVPMDYPKLFCWIYRHEGRKLKQELRCHAVLCPTHERAITLATSLRNRLAEALFDFRREKLLRQNARLSIVQSLYPNNFCGHVHTQNYKPPLERARTAPKLTSIEENEEPTSISPPPSHYLPSASRSDGPSSYHLLQSRSSPIPGNNPIQHHHSLTTSDSSEMDTNQASDSNTGRNSAQEEEDAPSCSTLNLPTLNCYSKVMLHLLELPQMSETSASPEYPGSSNSDPVNDSSDSDSHDEFVGQEINDDNVSDESGYSEETVDPTSTSTSTSSTGLRRDDGESQKNNQTIKNNHNNNNSNNNNNNNTSNNQSFRPQPTPSPSPPPLPPSLPPSPQQQMMHQQSLVLYDNLSFQI